MRSRNFGIVSLALPCVAGLAIFAVASTAQADEPKRFRLAVDTEFIGLTHYNPDGGDREDNLNTFGFGIARLQPIDGAAPAPIIGLSFGYVFLDGRAIVGAKVGLSVSAFSSPESEARFTAFGGQFVPYFRWVFLPGGTIRPYVEGHVGIGGGTGTSRFEVADEIVTTTGHTIYPVVGAGGGAHFFITPAVSIDLGLNFDYWAPHTRTTSSETVPDDERDYSKAADSLSIGVLAGFSAWF